MSTWIEYLTASVIAAFIAVTLFTVQLRSQEVTLDSSQFRSVKTRVLSTIEMIETDMQNVGSQHPSNSAQGTFALPVSFPITSPPDTTSSPRTFQFVAQPSRGAAPSVIRYEWTLVDSISLSNGARRPLFDLTRFVDGIEDGRSTGMLTQLSFNLLESRGRQITNLEETRQVFVEIRAVSPLGEARTVEETRWSSVFRPPALDIRQ